MRPRWEDHAACEGTILELWYGPETYDEPHDQRRWRCRRAKEICSRCPVRADCLAHELLLPRAEQHGIRGGMTQWERERLLAYWRAAGLITQHGPPRSVASVRNLVIGHLLCSGSPLC